MLLPKCIYPKSIFAKCTRLACLLRFAGLFLSDPGIPGVRSMGPECLIMGQYYGEMLAETGSFDVLFWYWVLGTISRPSAIYHLQT